MDPELSLSEESRKHASQYLWADGDLEALDSTSPAYGAPDSIVLALLARPSSPADWELLIATAFSPEGFAPAYSQSLGALVYVKVQDPLDESGPLRWVCWAFGSGSRSLVRGCLEPRFGLFAALNRLARADEGGLRQLEYRSFGAYRQRTGHTAGRDTPLDGFRIDPVIDLLSGIGGRTGRGFNAQVYGGRPLRLRTDVQGIADLRALAQAAMVDFRDASYRNAGFSFVDDFVPVDDPAELEHLRERLKGLLLSDSDRVDAFFPDDLVGYEDPRAIQFVLLPGELARKASRVTLTTTNLASALGDQGAHGLDRPLRFLDASGDLVATATVLDCVSGDFSLGDTRYVVSDGDFYRVREEFISAIDETIEKIPASSIGFPEYTGGEEAVWSQRVVEIRSDEFVCIDGQLVKLPGETSFEAADLVHVSGALVHAKRKGRSSALSYAMTQARRSCQMLQAVDEARKQLNDFVKTSAASSKVANLVIKSLKGLENTPPALDVVLVILGRQPRRGLLGLPLLAKLELSETIRQIGQMGFSLSVAQVGL
jgi:uncharacterized protein (TIGR04141 family)